MTTRTETDLRTRCYEQNLRVDRIVHLDTMAVEAIDSDLEEFLTDDAVHELGELIGVKADELRTMSSDELVECLAWNDATGWLLAVSTPVQTHHKPEGGFRYTWGICNVGVVTGATYEEAMEKAFTWAEEQAERDRKAEQ